MPKYLQQGNNCPTRVAIIGMVYTFNLIASFLVLSKSILFNLIWLALNIDWPLIKNFMVKYGNEELVIGKYERLEVSLQWEEPISMVIYQGEWPR